jgi:hypothetical protein
MGPGYRPFEIKPILENPSGANSALANFRVYSLVIGDAVTSSGLKESKILVLKPGSCSVS